MMSGFPIDISGSMQNFSTPVLRSLMEQQLQSADGVSALPEVPSDLLPVAPAQPSQQPSSGQPGSTIPVQTETPAETEPVIVEIQPADRYEPSVPSGNPVPAYRTGIPFMPQGGHASSFLPSGVFQQAPQKSEFPVQVPPVSASAAEHLQPPVVSPQTIPTSVSSSPYLPVDTYSPENSYTLPNPVASVLPVQITELADPAAVPAVPVTPAAAETFLSTFSEVLHSAAAPLTGQVSQPARTVSADLISETVKTSYIVPNEASASQFASPETSPLSAAYASVDPLDFATQFKSVLQPLFRSNGLSFQPVIRGSGLPAMAFDTVHAQQIITRLLTTAADFSPRGSVVDFITDRQEIDRDSALMRFVIQAPECALPAPVAAYFSKPSPALLPGPPLTDLALNLGLSRQIAEQLGGSLLLRSDDEGGIVFYLQLPARRRHSAKPQPEIGRFSGRHILLIEPDAVFREPDKLLLENREMLVSCAGSADEALHFFGKSHNGAFSAVLSAVEPDFAPQLRLLSRPDAHLIPIIALYREPPKGQAKPLALRGLDYALLRPFSPRELYDTLKLFIN
jgi:CheY-like chemotaxis protein